MSGFYHNQAHDDTNHDRPHNSIYTIIPADTWDDRGEELEHLDDNSPSVYEPNLELFGSELHGELGIFNEATRAPSEPHPSFLDNILNPAGLDHNRFSPFYYHPAVLSSNSEYTYPPPPAMPPSTRAQQPRPARLPNGYVDLTSAPDSPPQRRKRESATPGPSAKRQKRSDGSSGKKEVSEEPKIEEVDLTGEKESVQEVLQKQREDAVKSQTKPEEKPTTFNTFNCVICMDMPTDLTATACGHLFCHTCLMEALVAGENRAGPGEQKRSQCPVCRKFINRNKATDVIPLMLKKGLATQPRKKTGPTPAAATTKVQ